MHHLDCDDCDADCDAAAGRRRARGRRGAAPKLAAGLILAAALALIGAADRAPVRSPPHSVGPNPTLPAPKAALIPTVKIAPAVG